ncbi:ChaN family lipoprotein [Alloyangia pacifica]|uniref:ChaN family lipoprotein n=1 Tax=Alloyangia pacifica TaxID=311180 RepID=UPI001CFE725F|nr:ChaN family lipoprotein [Alloyangia pacifica]
MMRALALTLISLAAPVAAQQNPVSPQDGISALMGADVAFLGEVHDNPAHHARQAELVAQIAPVALVFEMLSPAQAAQVTPELIDDEAALEAALGWNDSGWPDFSMYYPIFAAAPEARIYGAELPREEARALGEGDLGKVFGPSAGFYGLDEPLDPEEDAARQQLQMAAHCNALPLEMLPTMVGIQRLRDARLAETALEAYADLGGPVVVITGNGHARKDWGAPALLVRAAGEVSVAALGQGETADGEAGQGAPDGGFDLVEQSPAAERDDPCEDFAMPQSN